MAENGRFDPMVLESRLCYYPETLEKTPLVGRAEANVVGEDPCTGITEAGAMGSSSLDLSPSSKEVDGTGTQVGVEHGPGTRTQLIGNGRIIPQQEQEVEGPVLNPRSEGLKKRKNWSEEETDLLLAAVASEKTNSKSRVDNEPLWEVVAKGVPGRTEKECRRRVETLKKSYNAVKKYCDKEEKDFADLNKAEFAKMELATSIIESWYNQIRDHCPPRPAKRSRARGPGSCLTSGEVGLVVGGLDNSGVISTNVATAFRRHRVKKSTAASGVLLNGFKSSEACNGRVGEPSTIGFRSERRHGAPTLVWMLVWCG